MDMLPPSTLTHANFVLKLEKLRVFQKNGRRAVHKPLLILFALARLQRGETSLLCFPEIEEKLQQLISQFGTTSDAAHPCAHYPFWYLKNEGFWQLTHTDEIEFRHGKAEPKLTWFRRVRVEGGFESELNDMFIRNPDLINAAAGSILQGAFPSSMHEEILDAIGLDLTFFAKKTRREARFRTDVLRAYGYCCAVCGYDGRIGDQLIGVEAAHIRWAQAGGPNDVSNGLALCSLHHKLFDAGGFTLSPENFVIRVSHLFAGRSAAVREMYERTGTSPFLPVVKAQLPGGIHLRWHASQVYRD